MKKSFYISVLIGSVLSMIFTVSCNNTPTYEELKAAEQKVIRRILDEKGITVLSEYPANGVFKEKEFVQLRSGIYLNVVDSGNGNRAVAYQTDVLIRASGEYTTRISGTKQDTLVVFSTFSNIYEPFEFRYGNAYGVAQEKSQYDPLYYDYFGMGMESILSYVGDSAIVKLIVPGHSEVNGAPGGSTMQNGSGSAYIPIYYDRVRYTFYK